MTEKGMREMNKIVFAAVFLLAAQSGCKPVADQADASPKPRFTARLSAVAVEGGVSKKGVLSDARA